MYKIDPNWVQPVDCYCVVRRGVWYVAGDCKWHGVEAHPVRQKMHVPIKRLDK